MIIEFSKKEKELLRDWNRKDALELNEDESIVVEHNTYRVINHWSGTILGFLFHSELDIILNED